MDSYQILKTKYKVGHPISGTVIAYEVSDSLNGFTSCRIEIQSSFEQKIILDYVDLFDQHTPFDEALIPAIGSRLKLVIKNYVDGILYVNAKPKDLSKAEIQKYKEFYQLVDSLEEGRILEGRVEHIRPFGIFVNLGWPFLGLIDIGHISFNAGRQLPYDLAAWPKVGEAIRCRLGYFRFRNRQLGLGWLPNGEQVE